MVQVHVTPQSTHSSAVTRKKPSPSGRCGALLAAQVGVAPLLSCQTPAEGGILIRRPLRCHRGGGFLAVKKLIVLAALGLGAFAVWRKVQSDRAELDLWTEATAADED